jgi:hypothetical protein
MRAERNRRCGKNLWVNGRRFCRAKRPTASARKGEDWRAIRISSAVSKWRETPASSIKVNKKQRHYGRARVPYSRKARHQQSNPQCFRCFPRFSRVWQNSHTKVNLWTRLRLDRLQPRFCPDRLSNFAWLGVGYAGWPLGHSPSSRPCTRDRAKGAANGAIIACVHCGRADTRGAGRLRAVAIRSE